MNHPLPIPHVDTTEVDWLNRLVALNQRAFALGYLPSLLIPDFAPTEHTPPQTVLVLRWENLPIYLRLDADLETLAASLLPTGIHLASLSENIILALFEKALLATYDTLLDTPCYLEKISTDPDSIPKPCYTLQWQPGHPVLRGQLCIPHHVTPALVKKLETLLPPVSAEQTMLPPKQLLALPMTVRMELGELNLPLNQIKGLKAYDLLIPEKSYFASGVMHLHLSASLGFSVKIENDTCTVVTPLENYRAHMNNNDHDFDDDFKKFLEDIPEATPQPESEHDDLDAYLDKELHEEEPPLAEEHPATTLEDVNIRLTFDIGHLQLTLGELSQITPGYTFNLGKSLHKVVTIRANDTIIGTGELVDIEGVIGVSIVELYQRGKA